MLGVLEVHVPAGPDPSMAVAWGALPRHLLDRQPVRQEGGMLCLLVLVQPLLLWPLLLLLEVCCRQSAFPPLLLPFTATAAASEAPGTLLPAHGEDLAPSHVPFASTSLLCRPVLPNPACPALVAPHVSTTHWRP